MATSIGFKRLPSLPDSPLITTFYLINDKDLYLGDQKLNNDDDLQSLLTRVAGLEYAIGTGGGGTTPVIPGTASSISVDDAGNNFQSNNVEGALAELAEKIKTIGYWGGSIAEFALVHLAPSDFTGTATEGGRSWVTAEVAISNHMTKLVHAIPVGNTLGDMPTKEQEKRVYAMRGFLYPDDNKMVFYSPTVPDADILMAIEGIET